MLRKGLTEPSVYIWDYGIFQLISCWTLEAWQYTTFYMRTSARTSTGTDFVAISVYSFYSSSYNIKVKSASIAPNSANLVLFFFMSQRCFPCAINFNHLSQILPLQTCQLVWVFVLLLAQFSLIFSCSTYFAVAWMSSTLLQGKYLVATLRRDLSAMHNHCISCCMLWRVSSDDKRQRYYMSLWHSHMTQCCLVFPLCR